MTWMIERFTFFVSAETEASTSGLTLLLAVVEGEEDPVGLAVGLLVEEGVPE